MPKKISKKNYRRRNSSKNKTLRGGWQGSKDIPKLEKETLPQKQKVKGGGWCPQTPVVMTGGGWGRARTRPIIYDVSPKMEMKKNFMNKYLKKYFN